MATKHLPNQDGISAIGDDISLLELPHWAFGGAEGLAISLSVHPFAAYHSPPDTIGPLFAPDVFSGFIADARGGAGAWQAGWWRWLRSPHHLYQRQSERRQRQRIQYPNQFQRQLDRQTASDRDMGG